MLRAVWATHSIQSNPGWAHEFHSLRSWRVPRQSVRGMPEWHLIPLPARLRGDRGLRRKLEAGPPLAVVPGSFREAALPLLFGGSRRENRTQLVVVIFDHSVLVSSASLRVMNTVEEVPRPGHFHQFGRQFTVQLPVHVYVFGDVREVGHSLLVQSLIPLAARRPGEGQGIGDAASHYQHRHGKQPAHIQVVSWRCSGKIPSGACPTRNSRRCSQ